MRGLPSIVASDYAPQPLRSKASLLVSVAGKSSGMTRLLMHALRARQLAGLAPAGEWLSLQGLSAADVARVLREARVVVFPSVEEGVPTFPIEAILSGCVVLSHGGGPQGEYLPPEFSFMEHDVLGLSRAIEGLLAARNLEAWQSVCDRVRAECLTRYAPERARASIVQTWRRVLEVADQRSRGKGRIV